MKKNAFGVFLALSMFWISGFYASVSYAGDGTTPAATGTTNAAKGYEPLVKIPGVDATEVDISNYLLGMYNFLLSIVGIVAVVMLIIGGMKYIMAAGSGGAVSSAKETIKDAILGLLLALLSYVIVGTINPDVLYLRQPGASFSKDNAGVNLSGGTFVKNPAPDGATAGTNYTFTTPEGYERIVSEETMQQLMSGEMEYEPDVTEKLTAMKKDLSCIYPGSVSGNSDPSYNDRVKCKCIDGTEKVTLPVGETKCTIACEKAEHCGNKFISIELNAEHGYTKNGVIDAGTSVGAVATDTASTDGTGTDIPVYDLTADAQVHTDKIFELQGVNKPGWGDFQIVYATTETTQSAQVGSTTETVPAKAYVEQGNELYPCAIMLTNRLDFGAKQHWVYWVTLGTTLGTPTSLYDNIKNGYVSNCTQGGGGYYGIKAGTCDQAWTDRVLLAKYSDDIVDKCVGCGLADGSDEKIYRFSGTVTCKGGYWQ